MLLTLMFKQDLCTVATVLMLAKACLKIHCFVSIEEIHAAWNLCCETLDILIKRGHPVDHALKGLCNMYQKFVGICTDESSSTTKEAPRLIYPCLYRRRLGRALDESTQ